jgi:hypothetical protein
MHTVDIASSPPSWLRRSTPRSCQIQLGAVSDRILTTVTEVLRALDRPGDRLWDAELYRLKGELTLQQRHVYRMGTAKSNRHRAKGNPAHHPGADTAVQAEAEECFLQALEAARR